MRTNKKKNRWLPGAILVLSLAVVAVTAMRWAFPVQGRAGADNQPSTPPISIENLIRLEDKWARYGAEAYAQEAKEKAAPKIAKKVKKAPQAPKKPVARQASLAAAGTQTAAVKIPILMYHRVRQAAPTAGITELQLTVTPANFVRQLDWLLANGYQTVDINALPAILAGQIYVEKPIVLTFDDGYSEMYTTVFPELKKRNMTGVFYVPSALVGKPDYLTRGQVIEMDRGGMRIGAHTRTHVNLLTSSDRATELAVSKVELESWLGHPVEDLSYPFGMYDASVLQRAKSIGYKTATTVKKGLAGSGSDVMQLKRLVVFDWTRIDRLLAQWLLPKQPPGQVATAAAPSQSPQ